jgi:hypothetical protein
VLWYPDFVSQFFDKGNAGRCFDCEVFGVEMRNLAEQRKVYLYLRQLTSLICEVIVVLLIDMIRTSALLPLMSPTVHNFDVFHVVFRVGSGR